jgi:hypothetical protein
MIGRINGPHQQSEQWPNGPTCLADHHRGMGRSVASGWTRMPGWNLPVMEDLGKVHSAVPARPLRSPDDWCGLVPKPADRHAQETGGSHERPRHISYRRSDRCR